MVRLSFSASRLNNQDPRIRHSSTPTTIENDSWLDQLQLFSHRGEVVINDKGKKEVQRVINEKGGGKQIITGYDKDWPTKTRDTNFVSTSIACILGEPSGVCVLDFDDAALYDELMVMVNDKGERTDDYRDRCWPTVKTQRGYHVYFEYSGHTREAFDSLPHAVGKLDLKRNGQIWYPGCRVKQRNGSYFRYEWMLHDRLTNGVGILCHMPCDLIDKIKAMVKTQHETPIEQPKMPSLVMMDVNRVQASPTLPESSSLSVSAALNPDQKRAALITGHHVLENTTWFQIMCAMRNSQCAYEDAVALTRRYLQASGKNQTSRFDKLKAGWDGAMANSKATMGTIIHHAKMCNQTALTRLCREEEAAESGKASKVSQKAEKTEDDKKLWEAYTSLKQDEPEWSDFVCADLYLERQEDALVYQRGVLYVYDVERVRWRIDGDGTMVQNDVNIYLTIVAEQWQGRWLELLDKAGGDKDSPDGEKAGGDKDGGGGAAGHLLRKFIMGKYIAWKKNENSTNSVTKTKNVYKAVLSRLALRGDAVEFDEQRDLFAWDNCVFDVRTGEQVMPKKEDYILTTNGQEWRESTAEEDATVAKMFEDTFPNETHRTSYETVLWTGTTGHRQEKFILGQGEGRNGKGAVNELALYMAGDYGATVNLCLLTQPMTSGTNISLRNLHKKRFTVASEPDEGFSDQLRASNIKAYTGNEKHEAAAKYSNDSDTRIHMTMVMECNDLPYIRGGTGEAMVARTMVIPFLVTFTNDPIKLASNPNKYKPLVEAYKYHDFQKKHAPALFKYLCSKGYSELIITEESRQLGFKYLCAKDELTAWFDNYYERDERMTVPVKDIFKKLKRTTFFTEMPKKEKSMYTYNVFKTNLEKSLALGKHLIQADQYYLGKRVKGYTMAGWKETPGMEDDDDDIRSGRDRW